MADSRDLMVGSNQRSLRRTLILTGLLLSTLFIVLTAFVLERSFRHALWERTEQQLKAQIYTLMAVAEPDTNGRLVLPREIADDRFNHWGGGRFARVLNVNGGDIWRSISAQGRSWASPPALRQGESVTRISRIDTLEVIEHAYRVTWESDEGAQGYIFVVAESYQDFSVALASFRWQLLLSLALLGGVMLLGQFLIFQRMLNPLSRVQKELAAIEAGLRHRLNISLPVELAGLVERINRLLDFEEKQRQRFQNSVGDLAHSLKTPLTIIANEIHSNGPDIQVIQDAVQRIEQMVQYYLNRARAVGPGSTQQRVDIADLIRKIMQAMQKVYADKRVKAEFQCAAPCLIRGHEGDLMEVLGNVIDNAFKYCRGKVKICLTQDNIHMLVSVEDDGPGIPENVVTNIFERGLRLDERTSGHGLGLSIVLDIVKAYEGEITVGRSSMGGARVVVKLQK